MWGQIITGAASGKAIGSIARSQTSAMGSIPIIIYGIFLFIKRFGTSLIHPGLSYIYLSARDNEYYTKYLMDNKFSKYKSHAIKMFFLSIALFIFVLVIGFISINPNTEVSENLLAINMTRIGVIFIILLQFFHAYRYLKITSTDRKNIQVIKKTLNSDFVIQKCKEFYETQQIALSTHGRESDKYNEIINSEISNTIQLLDGKYEDIGINALEKELKELVENSDSVNQTPKTITVLDYLVIIAMSMVHLFLILKIIEIILVRSA